MAAARPSTYRVRSRSDRTITLAICGLRYGGSSRVKDEGIPLRIVRDSSLEISKVVATPRTMAPRTNRAAVAEPTSPADAAVKMDARAMIVGKRPLHGTKLLVMMAIRRSLGESIILQAVTPAALQPNPIHIVRACLPGTGFPEIIVQVKGNSRQVAEVSRRVKIGKNIAIGGSITETTQANVRYMPRTRYRSQGGACICSSKPDNCSSNQNRASASSSDG